MAYTKTTWVNEVLVGDERFIIKDNAGAAPDAWADLAQCQITLYNTVTTAGTPVNATTMNNIEDGIYNLSRGAALSVKGITGNAIGDVADIAAGTDGYVLRRSGTALAFGQVAEAGIVTGAVTETKLGTGAVTNTKIRNSAATSVIGRSAGSSGAVADIEATVDDRVLRRVSGVLGFGTVPNAALQDHKELVYLKVLWHDEAISIGNGQLFFCVPAYLAGQIVDFDISIITASSSGLVTVQMANCGNNPAATGTDILSTRATIDVGEYDSMHAASQPAITNPNIVSGDFLRIDVDVAGTGAKGLDVFFVIEKSG